MKSVTMKSVTTQSATMKSARLAASTLNSSRLAPTALHRFTLALSAAVVLAGTGIAPSRAQSLPAAETTPEAIAPASPAPSQPSPQPTLSNLNADQNSAPPTHLLPQPTTVTIPADTGVIVSFLAPVAIDAGEGAYPMTLPLSQAIADSYGNIIVPENSPVSVLIQPEDGGAKVIAESIVINGKIVPIAATSPLIPGTTITHVRANDRAADEGATLGRMVASGFGFFNGGDPDAFDRGGMLGNLVGMATGRRDESSRVVQIPQGSVYVLALEESVTLRD